MIYIHANLFSHSCKCCNKDEKWHGKDFLSTNGYYCSKRNGKIEELIKKLYLDRKIFKKNNDSREKVFKIVLNSLYGITSKPIFKNIYEPNIA